MNMNYQHILEQDKYERKHLRFVKAINNQDGHTYPAYSLPEDWENVRHVAGNLYFDWDKDPLLGQIYLAEYD